MSWRDRLAREGSDNRTPANSAVSANSQSDPISGTNGTIGTAAEFSKRGHHQSDVDTEATTLTDGRKTHIWPAGTPIGAPGVVFELVAAARQCGAILIGDGDTLHFVEPRKGLPSTLVAGLRRDASTIVAMLRAQHRARTGNPDH